MRNATHIAGVVPCSGQPLNFQLPWHDCLQPIAANFLAVERAVLECATAGCETIWVICPPDMQPLIRYRMGDYVEDPVWNRRKTYNRFPSTLKKQIPIFYVPVHPKDLETKNSIPWSIIYGALTAQKISGQMSKWLIPKRYYVSFPYGVYPSHIVYKHRKQISDKGNALVECGGKTVRDGEYLGFTFDNEDLKKFKKIFQEKSSNIWDTSQPKEEWRDGKYPTRKLPLAERYSGRYLTIKDIFEEHNNFTHMIDVHWYYRIDSWEGLCQYLGAKNTPQMKRPKSNYLAFREWNGIGVNSEN